jgi:hypothetical protein
VFREGRRVDRYIDREMIHEAGGAEAIHQRTWSDGPFRLEIPVTLSYTDGRGANYSDTFVLYHECIQRDDGNTTMYPLAIEFQHPSATVS